MCNKFWLYIHHGYKSWGFFPPFLFPLSSLPFLLPSSSPSFCAFCQKERILKDFFFLLYHFYLCPLWGLILRKSHCYFTLFMVSFFLHFCLWCILQHSYLKNIVKHIDRSLVYLARWHFPLDQDYTSKFILMDLITCTVLCSCLYSSEVYFFL